MCADPASELSLGTSCPYTLPQNLKSALKPVLGAAIGAAGPGNDKLQGKLSFSGRSGLLRSSGDSLRLSNNLFPCRGLHSPQPQQFFSSSALPNSDSQPLSALASLLALSEFLGAPSRKSGNHQLFLFPCPAVASTHLRSGGDTRM